MVPRTMYYCYNYVPTCARINAFEIDRSTD